jgi:uncharacterized damage-inducible protein DinB
MNQYFKRLFIYNHWANPTTIDTLEHETIQNEYVARVFSHIINAQFIWIGRITNTDYNFKV